VNSVITIELNNRPSATTQKRTKGVPAKPLVEFMADLRKENEGFLYIPSKRDGSRPVATSVDIHT
jgi:hypothetical protein